MTKAEKRIQDRRAKVLELHNQGYGPMEIGPMIGNTPETIYRDRIALGLAKRRNGNYGASEEIDLGLAVLRVVNRTGQPLSLRQIAGICECSPEAIRQIERRAMRKVREKLSRCPELARDLLGEVA